MARTAAVRTALLAAAIALSGCGTMIQHDSAPADWPQMEVRVHTVSFSQMLGRCYKYMSLPMKLMGGFPVACAEVDLARNVCDIWMTDDENDPYILEHEKDHCAGKDHPHDMTLRNLWANYKAAR